MVGIVVGGVVVSALICVVVLIVVVVIAIRRRISSRGLMERLVSDYIMLMCMLLPLCDLQR